MDRPPSYLSTASLAKELDVSERTVAEMVRRGVLPRPVRLSAGCVRHSWASVEQALSSLAGGAEEAEDDVFLKGVQNVTAPRP